MGRCLNWSRSRTALTSSELRARGLTLRSSAQSVGPENRVNRKPEIALELSQPRCCPASEDPVDASYVETESREPPLQLGDVVTAQHELAVVEEAVTELEARLDKSRPGLRPASRIDPEAAKVLESLDRRSSAGTEDPGLIGNYVDPQCGQARLQVRDRWPGVTGLQVQTRPGE